MTIRLAYLMLTTVVLCVAVYVNVDAYVEYFSDGPPYYGRSTNMDKWIDPRLSLFAIDAVLLCMGIWSTRRWMKGRGSRPNGVL